MNKIKSLVVFSLAVLSISLFVPAIQSQALKDNAGSAEATSHASNSPAGCSAGADSAHTGYRFYLLYGDDSEYYAEARKKYDKRDEHGILVSPAPGLDHLRGHVLSSSDINWNAYNIYGVVDVLYKEPFVDPYNNTSYISIRDHGVKQVPQTYIPGGVRVYNEFLPGMPKPVTYSGGFRPNGDAFREWMLEKNPTYGVENAILLIYNYFGEEALREFNDSDNAMFLSAEPITWHNLSYDHLPSNSVINPDTGYGKFIYGTFADWLYTFDLFHALREQHGEEKYPKEQYPDHGCYTEVLDNDVLGVCMMLEHPQPEIGVYSLSPGPSNYITRADDRRRMLSYVSVECPNDRASGLLVLTPGNNTYGWHLYYNKDMVVDDSTHTWDYEKEIEAEAPDPSKEDPGEYEKLPEEDKQYIIVKSYRLRNEDTGELTDRGTFIREETVGKIRIEDEELKEYSYKVKAWATSSGEINRLIKSTKWEEGIPREVGDRGDGESTVVLFLDSWIS